MKNAFVPNSEAPLLNGLADVEAYEKEASEIERFPIQSSYALFENAAELYGDDLALQFLLTAEENEKPVDVSYRQLLETITKTANALTSLGVTSTDSVTVMLTNLLHSHYAIWGSQAAGISSPINPLLESEHVIQIIKTTKSKTLVTMAPLLASGEHWEKVKQIASAVPNLETILLVAIDGYTKPFDCEEVGALKSDSLAIYEFDEFIATQAGDKLNNKRQFKGEDTASYFHTGGTTGRPKIAQVTHWNIAFVGQILAHLTKYRGRFATMVSLPLFHIYGLISAGIATTFAGRTIVMMTPDGSRNPNVLRNWWHHIARFKVEAFGSVPTILTALMQVPAGDNDVSCLHDVGSGAAPLPKQLRKDFEKNFGVRVTNGYGMTETTCIMTRQRAEAPAPEGSVGTRFPYAEIRTVELDGNRVIRDCKANESGVLIVRAPYIFKGYLDPEDNAKAWVDGDWFNTGDVAFIDEGGFVTLTGRAKDLIIRGGHNIDPIIIEEPLSKHPAVAQVVAIGQPDAYAGEIPIAYVQLKPGQKDGITAEELLAYCAETISERAAIPKRIEIIDAMPTTAVGKFFKPELRNQATLFVLNAAMQEHQINGDIDVYFEQKRGHVARVKLQKADQLDEARSILEKFPVTIEF
ncbi:acyl-CoA synthetase [Aurantivibrio infirmus]